RCRSYFNGSNFFRNSSGGCFRLSKLIEETVHFLGGKDGRNAFRQLRSGHEPRRIFFQHSFTHTLLEKRTQRRQLPRDGSFLQSLREKMPDVFAYYLVIDFVDSRYRLSGRGEIGGELLQILAVVQNGVRGG